MKIKNRILIIGLPLILVACSTTQPSKFYLLSSMETSQRYKEPQLGQYAILVKPIKFPEYLDRPQMVLRENDYKLQFNEFHRWAEPLKDNFIRVFMENLNSRIAPANALFFSELGGIQPNYQLAIEVFRLDVNADNQAVLSVKWALLTGKNNQHIKTQSKEYSIPFKDNSYLSGVEAQSKAISQFTDQIADYLRDLNRTSKTKTKTKTIPTQESYSGFQINVVD